ncbi:MULTISPECIES: replication initiator [Nocardia]|uniref:replication initiator n=1 Tax=Nocardia TaxID=1817 RepID=UPI0018E542A8|nr:MULTISPECIES: replication initiator [Nocardia]
MQSSLLDDPVEVTGEDGQVITPGHGPSMLEVAIVAADRRGVCVRPVVLEQTDTRTGRTTFVPVPCGATLESKCGPCARKARALRKAQCREGWHATTEPVRARARPTYDQEGLIGYRADLGAMLDEAREVGNTAEVAEIEAEFVWIDSELAALGMRGKAPKDCAADEITQGPTPKAPRKRSTRRRQDVPKTLPRLEVADRTVGSELGGHYSSMFVTLTMPSYGKVYGDGSARNPGAYDYQRAAWDAITCSRLFSRWIQNLRRAIGWNVQYFAVVEPQKRGAPHLHIALRGAIPRALLIAVNEATYHQVWWPRVGEMVYPGAAVPVWDEHAATFTDPRTHRPLTGWEDALDAIGPTDQPAHKAAFGPRIDVQGIAAGTKAAGEAIGYLCKYLTKSVTEVLEARTSRQLDHYDRLHAALCRTPCGPRCAIWLLYGIVPKGANAKTVPGICKGRAHRRETLALPGNRVLTSEEWTGKTLGDHKADRLEFVRRTLAAVGLDKPAQDPRQYTWATVAPGTRMPSRTKMLLSAIGQRIAWRAEYDNALYAAQHPDGDNHADDGSLADTCSATGSSATGAALDGGGGGRDGTAAP